jgi:hypothetical protein
VTDFDELREVLRGNRTLVEVLQRVRAAGPPGRYLTAGCVVQTVWNVRTGRAAARGVEDYDLFCAGGRRSDFHSNW